MQIKEEFAINATYHARLVIGVDPGGVLHALLESISSLNWSILLSILSNRVKTKLLSSHIKSLLLTPLQMEDASTNVSQFKTNKIMLSFKQFLRQLMALWLVSYLLLIAFKLILSV